MFDFGENLGICFQIKDDIFDYYNDIEIGKPTGNDLQDGKVTLPLIYALQNGDETERAKVITIIQNKDFTAANIDYIMQYARQSGGVSYAESKIAEYKQKAMDLLNQLPMSDYKKSLEFCLEYTSARKH